MYTRIIGTIANHFRYHPKWRTWRDDCMQKPSEWYDWFAYSSLLGYGILSDGKIIFVNASTCNINYLPVNPPIVFDVPLPPSEEKIIRQTANTSWIRILFLCVFVDVRNIARSSIQRTSRTLIWTPSNLSKLILFLQKLHYAKIFQILAKPELLRQPLVVQPHAFSTGAVSGKSAYDSWSG